MKGRAGGSWDDMVWTPERKALHDAIEAKLRAQWAINEIERKLAMPGLSKKARASLRRRLALRKEDAKTVKALGGGPASGKSTVVKTAKFDKRRMTIDVNEIRVMLPEYKEWQAGLDSMTKAERWEWKRLSARRTHDEASYIAGRIKMGAQRDGVPMLVDGTMAGDWDDVIQSMNTWRRRGATRLESLYVTAETDEAWRRALVRARKSGRDMPIDYFYSAHADISKTFPKLVEEGRWDHVQLWDKNERSPRIIGWGDKDGWYVKNQKLWEDFKNKKLKRKPSQAMRDLIDG